jgi:hypothetical protein
LRAIADASWVHSDHHGWPLVAELWPTLSRSPNGRPKLSVDDGHPIGDPDPALIDLYVPALPVLRRRSGRDQVADAVDWALARGARAVVTTDGGSGSYGRIAGDQLIHQPAADTEVISTLGAGDVFHGALVAATSRGLDLSSAIGYASRIAAMSCEALDGRGAIPDTRTGQVDPAWSEPSLGRP